MSTQTRIFTIADLHLSFAVNKPMDIFGNMWENHEQRICEMWNEKVGENDWVIIPGDISWGMNEEEALPDLKFVNSLPGKKILMKGNHEYWWSSLAKLRRLKDDNGLNTLYFLQNSAIEICGNVICGTRGWKCPGDSGVFSADDERVYKRELVRLEISLQEAEKLKGDRIICFTHFPPFNDKGEKSGFTELMKKYGVQVCFYGHVHGTFGGVFNDFEDVPVRAVFDGIQCRLVSADYVGFSPVRIV